MANLSVNLSEGIIKYTKNGYRLLSKTTERNTKTAIIETDFGKGIKKVIQKFGKDGKVSNLTITHYDNQGNELNELIRSYSKNKGYTQIETFKYENKTIITNCSTEKQQIINELDGSKSLLRIKFDEIFANGKRYEKQAYEYLHNAKNKDLNKNLYTTAIRLDDGQVINKTVSGNLTNLDEIAKDPYLHIRNYPKADFAEAASYIAAQKQGVSRGNFIDKCIKEDGIGYIQGSKNVYIDSAKCNKEMIIDIVNHEYRHKYQIEQINKLLRSFLNIFKSDKNKILMTPTERKQAKAFLKAHLKYGSSGKRYYFNLLEIDAEKAGERAKKIYHNYSKKLAQIFNGEDYEQMFDLLVGTFYKKEKASRMG